MFNLISKKQCVGQPDKPAVQMCSGWTPSLQRLAVGVISLLTFRKNNGYQGSTSGDTQPGMLERQGALWTPLPSSQPAIKLMLLG